MRGYTRSISWSVAGKSLSSSKSAPDFVGFGLVYEDVYCNLPYLAALAEADLQKHAT